MPRTDWIIVELVLTYIRAVLDGRTLTTMSCSVPQGEQEEYVREGIQWSYVDFVDNQDCLDLLEGGPAAPALGVFPLIDEANRIARATSEVRSSPPVATYLRHLRAFSHVSSPTHV